MLEDCQLLKNSARFLLEELPLNMRVRDVEHIENGSKGVYGTLYMTTFRLVFAPDKENADTDSVESSERKENRKPLYPLIWLDDLWQ